MNKIDLLKKFNLIQEYWTPKIVGELNGQYVKIAKLKGEFVWHAHEEEDELFQVVKGQLWIDFRDRTCQLEAGDLLIVPRGVEHRPRTASDAEAWVMLFEPKATKHTGEVEDALTVRELEWI